MQVFSKKDLADSKRVKELRDVILKTQQDAIKNFRVSYVDHDTPLADIKKDINDIMRVEMENNAAVLLTTNTTVMGSREAGRVAKNEKSVVCSRPFRVKGYLKKYCLVTVYA